MKARLLTTLAVAGAALVLGGTPEADACTSLIVGKKASADGSVIITYNADSYGMFGTLRRFPAAKHPKGAKRRIIDGDTNRYLGEIDEAPETYSVIGNINEHQLAIGETTFGGRHELADPEGVIDYVSLMSLGLQRAKTAREEGFDEIARLFEEIAGIERRHARIYREMHDRIESATVFERERPAVWVCLKCGNAAEGVRPPEICPVCGHSKAFRMAFFALRDMRTAMGVPTILLRPTTTQCFPSVSIPERVSKSTMPAGVAGRKVGKPSTMLPTL